MRFYEISFFLFITMATLTMIGDLNIFASHSVPTASMNMSEYSDSFSINQSADSFSEKGVYASTRRTLDFFGFILKGGEMLINILYKSTLGLSGFLQWELGLNGEARPIATTLALIVNVIYAMGIVQFFTGRHL